MKSVALGIALLLVGLWLPSWSSSAFAADHPLSARVVAGVSSSWISPQQGLTHVSHSTRMPSFGIFVARQQSPRSALETGLVVEGRGTSWSSHYSSGNYFRDDITYVHELRMTYVSVPLFIRAGVPVGPVELSVRAGLQVGYLLGVRYDTNDQRTPDTYWGDRQARHGLPSWESAAAFGGRVGTQVLGRKMFLESTYVHGLTSASPKLLSGEGGIPRFRNRVFGFGLGVFL